MDKERANYANAGQAGGVDTMALTKAYREKTWDECGIEEKVERLRGVLQDTRSWNRSLAEQQRHVQPHQHGQHGEILIAQGGYGLVGAQIGGGHRPYDPLD